MAGDDHEKACYYIGHCHYFGLGPYIKDYSEAIRWFRQSRGYKKSATGLGNCYFFGYCVTRDYTVALDWYHLAANKGCAEVLQSIDSPGKISHWLRLPPWVRP
jgi:TPR repeat protein